MPGNENFGAIVFDRPESLDRGWYCLGEGEPGRLPDDGAAGLPRDQSGTRASVSARPRKWDFPPVPAS